MGLNLKADKKWLLKFPEQRTSLAFIILYNLSCYLFLLQDRKIFILLYEVMP